MDLRILINKGISIRKQMPMLPDGGPITNFLRSLSRFASSSASPISPVGADVARLFAGRSTRVVYMHTEGSGITPWRGLIVLDADYREAERINSPAKIGLVAHELTHLLQRDLEPQYFWPSGGLRPSISRRWIGDSTNYMEVLAYLVGWTIEHDFTAAQVVSGDLSHSERARKERVLKTLRNRLATLSGNDARNACRLVLKIYSNNPIYRQNYRLENRLADGRIPPGSWHYWLGQLGFSLTAIDHIMLLAAQGQGEWINPAEIGD
jgi:hypothetical protein